MRGGAAAVVAPSSSSSLPSPDRAIVAALTRFGSRLSLPQLSHEVRWPIAYEGAYGDLKEFLFSYKVLFTVNPATSEVSLRRSRRPPKTNNGSGGAVVANTSDWGLVIGHGREEPMASEPTYHSCGYASLCERFDLDVLERVYKRRGLATSRDEGVLIVSFPNVFEMFLFASGAVVWWGAARGDHSIVEGDLWPNSPTAVPSEACVDRHSAADVAALFPVWSTYRVDESMGAAFARGSGEANAAVFAAFRERLPLDHFRVPAATASFPTAETEAKMAISFALASAAKADFFEHVTLTAGKRLEAMTSKTGLVEHLVGSRRLREPWMLEGELRSAQLMMACITDEPDFLWEKPYLKDFFALTMESFSVEGRRDFFNDRCDAQYQLIDSITERRHRVFMMRSDFFLIVVLALDVCFLLFRLTLVLYMKGSAMYLEDEW